MRLIDEIITQSAYLDYDSNSPIEYVALSMDAYLQISREIFEETDKEEIGDNDIEDFLTMKFVLMPTLISIDYRFLKEIKL
jgi:hypothetical protein